MMVFSLEVRGARDARGRFTRATAEIRAAQRAEMQGLGRRIRDAVRAEAPVRTGRLRRGIGYRTADLGKSVEVRLRSEAFYTKWVLFGRGPVVATRARALRFEPGPPGSGFIFRKRVGPAKANPFVGRALRRLAADGEPRATANRIGQRVVRSFAIA